MKITITREELEAADACEEGLAWFDSIAPDGIWSGDWTHQQQIALATGAGRAYAQWAMGAHLLPAYNLTGANLTDARLKGAYLKGANLTGAAICP